ncbi:Uncharacterized protein PECH_001934 [Penicillium ucsense]|uniref:SWI5-dependent HO expression protein 3 n=1 Tax=Penicillium ucsense TaxID=2839758 RepID=A0A8J8WHG1_9EURO|nr:Uncharacterized protein PECM_008422 [Penicillium ucsense]KAF7731496.1 Uncharacterized protein PECH_001934 [Penicillium ucsense]
MVKLRHRIATPHLALLKFENKEDAPQVNLARVDTQLNMHQFNNLFEEDAGANGSKDSNSLTSQAILASPYLGNELPAEWSAVGHAAATGKSGRVIHSLQEEVARQKREAALWQSRAEESQRTNETLKFQLQNTTDRLSHLEQVNETNGKLIERKDRKIEDMRAELHTERTKRLDAQGVANETNETMRVERENHHREMARLQEEAKYHENQYEVLFRAMKQDKADLTRRMDALHTQLARLKETQVSQNEAATRLLTVDDQRQRLVSSLQERHEQMMALHQRYKEIKEQEFQDVLGQARVNGDRIDASLRDLKETEDKMKWVIRMSEVQQGQRGDDNSVTGRSLAGTPSS